MLFVNRKLVRISTSLRPSSPRIILPPRKYIEIMNALFITLVLISLTIMLITSPAEAFPTMIAGVRSAIELSLKLLAIYAVWLSVLRMMEATGLDAKLSRLLRPVIRRLFKGESESAYSQISVNLSANMLGMGGVATPAGIRAMAAMQDGSDRITHNMALLIVINATSVQLVPATVIALRAAAGSEDASSVFFPTLIATTLSTLAGIIICKTLSLKSDPRTPKTRALSRDYAHIKSDFSKYIAKMRKS